MALAGISISQSPAASDVAEAMPSAEPQPKGFGRRVPAKINTAQGAPRRLWAAACALMMGTKKCEGDEKGKHPKYEPSADCDQEDAYGTDQDTVSTASASVSGDSGPEDSGFSGDSGSEDSDVGSDREDGEAFIRQASHGSTVAQPEEVRDEAPPVSPVAAPVQYGRNALLRWRHAAGTAEASENNTGIIVQAAPAVPVPPPSADAAPPAPASGPAEAAPAAWRPRRFSSEGATAAPPASATAKAALAPSAGSWAAQQRRKREEASGADPDDAEVVRSVKSILNKLTVEKFEALYAKLTSCGIRTPAHMELLVGEIFGKATAQHHFVKMYADLCSRLEGDFPATAECNFKRILLDQCQKSFEGSLEPLAEATEQGEDAEEAAARQKERILGNIKLVGELLTRKMLSSRVLIGCANDLLRGPPAADRLESLAVLLRVTGPTFDDPKWAQHEALDAVFTSVGALSTDPLVHSRVRCLFQDVLDLRAARWIDTRRATRVEAPKRLEDVHREAAAEALPTAPQGPAKRRAEAGKPRTSTWGSQAPRPAADQREQGKTKDASAACSDLIALLRSPPSETAQPPRTRPSPNAPAHPANAATAVGAAPGAGKRQKRRAATSETLPPPAPPAEALPRRHSAPTAASAAPPAAAAPAAPAPPAVPVALEETEFDLAAFHRDLSASMRELAATRDAASAVRRFRAARLPVRYHASEFCNILTRSAEEPTGGVRRVCFAFLASLAEGTLDKPACAEGARAFFEDVFDDLCDEVPGLPSILAAELIPTMRGSLPSKLIDSFRRRLPPI